MYTLGDVVVPQNCQKLGPFPSSTDAVGVPCPTGTTFNTYGEDAGQTVKICCSTPAQLTTVASLNSPAAPITPLDCVKGTYFIADGTGNRCVYCFPTAGGQACPGLPGIGRKAVVPVAPIVTPSYYDSTGRYTGPTPAYQPAYQTPVSPIPVEVKVSAGWLENNWKWLTALGLATAVVYSVAQRRNRS
jgi:hypothetical protein